jgi:hypothetical protein
MKSNTYHNSTKKCGHCKKTKDKSLFYKRSVLKDGYRSECKTCSELQSLNYTRTRKGLVTMIFKHQRSSSKKRGHVPPNYTKKELYEWVIGQSNFETLYNNWVNSDYEKNLFPSCDRLEDDKPYSFDNLRMVTWDENNKKGYENRRNGTDGIAKPVIGVNKKTKETVEFISTMEAGRNGFLQSKISMCCLGKRKSHKGYVWTFKGKPEHYYELFDLDKLF